MLGIALLVVRRGEITAYGLRFLAAARHPAARPRPLVAVAAAVRLLPGGRTGVRSAAASALDLLGASPGGPGTVSGLLLIGIVLRRARRAAAHRAPVRRIWTAWAVALVALVFAVLSNGSTWAGPATLVYGLALPRRRRARRRRAHARAWPSRASAGASRSPCSSRSPRPPDPLLVAAGLDDPRRRRAPGAPRPRPGARVRRRGERHPRPGPHPRPRQRLAGHVGYTLVRGSGARLGDAELAAADGENKPLDKVVANLVAGSGADQADQLGGYAVRYVLVRDGAPREVSRVLDATPGLTRLSQQDGSALWRVDRQVSRAAIVPGVRRPAAHRRRPRRGAHQDPRRRRRPRPAPRRRRRRGLDGHPRRQAAHQDHGRRLGAGLRTARHRAAGWTSPSRPRSSHTAWLWAQGALAVVLVVLALPGRRRDVDDDLPEEPVVPAQAVAGEGRRARRLRAQAEAEQADQPDQFTPDAPPATPPPSEEVPVRRPGPAAADLRRMGHARRTRAPSTAPYGGEQQYQGAPQYPAGTYDQQQYQADPYQTGQYDPYATYGTGQRGVRPDADSTPRATTRRTTRTQHQQPPHGTDSERPDGSQQ